MATSLINPTDLQDYLGEQIDQDRAFLFCDLAEGLIAEAVGGAIPDPAPVIFRAIAFAVITRVITNPRGVISESIGSYSYNLNRNDTSSGMTLTTEERKALRRAAGLSPSRSVQLVPTTLDPRPTWYGGYGDFYTGPFQ